MWSFILMNITVLQRCCPHRGSVTVSNKDAFLLELKSIDLCELQEKAKKQKKKKKRNFFCWLIIDQLIMFGAFSLKGMENESGSE